MPRPTSIRRETSRIFSDTRRPYDILLFAEGTSLYISVYLGGAVVAQQVSLLTGRREVIATDNVRRGDWTLSITCLCLIAPQPAAAAAACRSSSYNTLCFNKDITRLQYYCCHLTARKAGEGVVTDIIISLI